MGQTDIPTHDIPWPTLESATTDLIPSFPEAEQSDIQPASEKAKETNAQELLLLQHAQTSCLSLCTRISHLPRELRDQIYTHLTHEPTVNITGIAHKAPNIHLQRIMLKKAAMHGTRIETQPPPKPLVLGIKTQIPVHVWDVGYTGVQFRKEMMETWYRSSVFSIKFSERDMTQPIAEEVHNPLQIALQQIFHLRIEMEDWAGMGGSHSTTDAELDRMVEYVQMLKPGSRVEVFYVYLDGQCCPDYGQLTLRRHCEFVERVMPWLRRMEEAGYGVSLHVDGFEFVMGGEVKGPGGWIRMLEEQNERNLKEWLEYEAAYDAADV